MGRMKDLFGDTPYPLYDGRPPRLAGSDTSGEAADSLHPRYLTNLHERVFKLVSSRVDGLTCDDVERLLDLRHQTASARIRELVQFGRIYDTGQRRRTSSRRMARIYKATEGQS